ncbi:hypothetical protein F511_31521 [Dorcoceras hygrometricum]|uniref:Uncharacterized protein n=1 Tax=Dorcoceras hygrometricum TaxID=472368 RepID=A0A2Z7AVL0_9LAMI|nr:hypothetical protein F511_31521 [Dorcoceras hygrometricum]
MHCFISADEDFSRLFVEVVQQLPSLFVEESYTTSFKLVGTTAFWIDSAEAFFRDFSRCIVSADGYSDSIQQMLYLLLSSRCISKIAKRRHLIKLTRYRFC